MSKKRICFIAQFPPPMHGLSKAVETLYNSDLNDEYELEKIDITDNRKFLLNLLAIKRSRAELFYFTISQSTVGNLRDLIIIKAIGNRSCLIHLHGGYYRTMVEQLPTWQKRANYKAVERLAGAIVLGPSLKWIFQGMIAENKIFTVPNCVDNEYIISDTEFEEKLYELDCSEIKHVLYLSNFIKSKGYPEVLKMAKLEKERVDAGGQRKFHFDFAGKFFAKKEEEFFWKYIKENGIDEYVTYHGVVDGKKKTDLLKKCHVFVLLTTYPKEGQPISILEAMANGMVIVTTNHAGIGDIVADEASGIVVSSKHVNVKNIYEQMITKLDYHSILKKNRCAVKNQFNQSFYIKNMRNCFSKT